SHPALRRPLAQERPAEAQERSIAAGWSMTLRQGEVLRRAERCRDRVPWDLSAHSRNPASS
ncbi:hypothetical protein, partial [Escherichia coli]|uniref:hypothetical protein n=1 Tax=Escherichia coli TaxID=562 RepID=UPI00200DE28D